MPSPQTRLWRCPGCAKSYRISEERADPTICPACEAGTKKATPPPIPTARTSPLNKEFPARWGIWLVLGVIAAIGVVTQTNWSSSPSPATDRDEEVATKNEPAQPQNRTGEARQFQRYLDRGFAQTSWYPYIGKIEITGNVMEIQTTMGIPNGSSSRQAAKEIGDSLIGAAMIWANNKTDPHRISVVRVNTRDGWPILSRSNPVQW